MKFAKYRESDFRSLWIASMAVCLPAVNPAAAQPAIWNGRTGNWNNAALWNTGIVPNDHTIDVLIDSGNPGTSVVNLNISATARTISLDADDTLQFSNSKNLYLTGGGTFNGNVNLAKFDLIQAIGSQIFSGTGQISLLAKQANGNGGSIIVGSADGITPATLTLGAGLTVRGAAGFIGTDLTDGSHVVNQGTILTE